MSNFQKKLGKRVRELRERLELTQEDLGNRLKVSRLTITQIEKGQRKISAEELIKLSQEFGVSAEILSDTEKEPLIILSENKTSKKPQPQVRINVPQRNVEKFKQVLLYILNKVASKPNIGETVIYKLLYFIDFNYYEKYEEQLIGATYIKNRYGPTPREFKKIVAKMIKDKEIRKVEDKYYTYPQTKYLPLKKPDLTKLKASETKEIDDVLNYLSDMNANEIHNYASNDVPWLTAETGKNIEYEAVFYRTAPYSVRRYNETDIS